MEELRRYGFTWEEAEKWAKEKGYQDFLSNRRLIVHLFLKERGRPIEIPRKFVGPSKKIKDLQLGEVCVIRFIPVEQVAERKYIGCANCFKKLDNVEVGQLVQCPSCGVTINAMEFSFRVFFGGDETAEIMAVIPPRITEEIQIGKPYLLNGSLNEREEFLVRALEQVPAPTPQAPQPSQPVQSQPVAPVQPTQVSQPSPAPPVPASAPTPVMSPEVRFVRLAYQLQKKLAFIRETFAKRFPNGNYEQALKDAGLKEDPTQDKLVPDKPVPA
jgi:DNA-directed RNA polymerase subunit RPC12/RpoP